MNTVVKRSLVAFLAALVLMGMAIGTDFAFRNNRWHLTPLAAADDASDFNSTIAQLAALLQMLNATIQDCDKAGYTAVRAQFNGVQNAAMELAPKTGNPAASAIVSAMMPPPYPEKDCCDKPMSREHISSDARHYIGRDGAIGWVRGRVFDGRKQQTLTNIRNAMQTAVDDCSESTLAFNLDQIQKKIQRLQRYLQGAARLDIDAIKAGKPATKVQEIQNEINELDGIAKDYQKKYNDKCKKK